MSDGAPFDCASCDERLKNKRNCRNRKGFIETILVGANEWASISSKHRPVLKLDDLMFMACPTSTITPKTWEALGIVNNCITAEHGDWHHFPYPNKVTGLPGGLFDQPGWLVEAVAMVRNERNTHRRKIMEKLKHVRQKN